MLSRSLVFALRLAKAKSTQMQRVELTRKLVSLRKDAPKQSARRGRGRSKGR